MLLTFHYYQAVIWLKSSSSSTSPCHTDSHQLIGVSIFLHVWMNFTLAASLHGSCCCYYSSFKRILPLPSGSWEEFSGSVFCHDYHSKGKESALTPSSLKITPKEGDCLYSDSVLLLTDSSLDWQNIHKVLYYWDSSWHESLFFWCCIVNFRTLVCSNFIADGVYSCWDFPLHLMVS